MSATNYNNAVAEGGEQQRSYEWFRRRLGYFTGSEVYKLMSSGRNKDKDFSDTAMQYLEAKAAERCIDKNVYTDDYWLQTYLDNNGVYVNRQMQYGIDNEDVARHEFATEMGVECVEEVGSCRHASIPFFAASPDGLFTDADGKKVNIEIKVPKEATFVRYVTRIRSAEDLREVKPEYFWQIVATQACTGADYSYFITYSNFTYPGLYFVRIDRDEEMIKAIEQRVILANKKIYELVQILKNS